MGLKYPSEWKFGSVSGLGVIPPEAVQEFETLAAKIAAGARPPQQVIERFKSNFSALNGETHMESSSYSWAVSDLSSKMSDCADRAPLFIDAYWSSVCEIGKSGIQVPAAKDMNAILSKHGIPYVISPPDLLSAGADAAITPAGSTPQPATTGLDRYSIIEEIGRGGFGKVVKAQRTTSVGTFDFAVKIHDPSAFIKDPERAKDRFSREVKIIQRLQHRGIVSCVEAGMDLNGAPYLVMPFINGKDLRSACVGQGFHEIGQSMMQVLEAVSYAHKQGVFHRDLKPSNILVRDSDRQAIIVDFGLAYFFDEMNPDSWTTQSLLGTTGYIPLEIIANPKLRSPLQDIYACGVITYELIAGHLPVPNNYEPLQLIQHGCAVLDPVIEQAIAPAPKRFQSARAFAEALAECLNN
jgi:predicted Ser/Thr protein kinase